MAKFYDVVGYGHKTETAPGVFMDVITERSYFGDLTRNSRAMRESQEASNELTAEMSVSILADDYANENKFAIRYVRWEGSLWYVRNVETQRPRLILRLGGVYNGPVATP